MNGPRIGGIEPPEPTPLTPPPPSAETSAAIRAEPAQEDRNAIQRANWLLVLVAGLAMVVATGSGIYAHRLHVRVAIFQMQLTQTRATAQAALEKVGALKIPKDLSTEVASLEVTANKLRAADEALRRSLNDDVQKMPALDARLSDAHKALVAKQTEAEQELKAFREKNEGRLTNIIAVLKNQDKVLRRLAEASAAPQNQE
jgi:hypothetical protein